MVIFTPLFAPPTAGLEPITRIRYPVPLGVANGIVAAMVPEVVAVSAPILTPGENIPDASDNCAVKKFPAAKVP